MQLTSPLAISARLLPAVQIGNGWLSWDASKGTAHLDTPTFEHTVSDFRVGPQHMVGDDDHIRACLGGLCSFLGACAESRAYAVHMGGDEMDGENAKLFPPEVGEWAEQFSDEIGMIGCELENGCEAL